jgi:hypothetical protein
MQEAIVNEEGWFASTKPEPMLAFLQGRASVSKLRLFACACCRRVWPLLTDARSRAAVEVAERYADGLADARELAAVRTAAVAATHRAAPAALAAYWATSQNPAVTVGNVCAAAAEAEARAAVGSSGSSGVVQAAAWEAAGAAGALAQVALLRDLFDNPFRPVSADPAWRSGIPGRIAHAIHAEARFEDLPILADALEEAGCTESRVLSHCRGLGPHARGCWVVDLLLGKP